MDTKKYNGWANYATWRINLELLSDPDWSDTFEIHMEEEREDAICAISKDLAEYVDDYIDHALHGSHDESLVQGWARAFADDCNYWEIAKHIYDELIDDYKLNNILDEIEDQ